MIIQTNKPLPPRRESDFYPTPDYTIRSAFELLNEFTGPGYRPKTILDPGCGEGPWGRLSRHWWRSSVIDGVDSREVPKDDDYDGWWQQDFTTMEFLNFYINKRGQADLIWGNPPYRDAQVFVENGLNLLAPGGYMVYLLRLAFLEGQKRRDFLFNHFPPRAVGVCSKRPSFQEDGKTNATAFALFLWRKNWHGVPSLYFL